jgi:hypothetical protein
VNSHADKLFGKRIRIDYFIIVGVVMWTNDRRETTVKGNDGGGWSSGGVVLWLQMRQNRDAVKWWGEWLWLR